MLNHYVHCTLQYLIALCELLRAGLRAGFGLGLMLGMLFGPGRVSGVDFRQWFWDPTQTSEVMDDSWVGLLRGTTHRIFLGTLVTLLVVATWQWFGTTCRLDHVDGVLSFIADCGGFWVQWEDLFGILVGFALAQSAVELFWSVGLRWLLPLLPIHDRATLQRNVAVLEASVDRPKRRRLIICCDGTWNWPQPDRETNVVRLVRAINPVVATGEPGGPVAQIVHYHLGVGTGNILDRIVGGGAGAGLSNSVKACYGFLVDNYAPGDEILLFGFSRGAYVARSIAGLVGCVGLMQKQEMGRFFEMWDWYTNRTHEDIKVLDGLSPDRHRPEHVTIQCIGVWDTVGALGIPGTRFCAQSFAFHDTELGTRVRHAFQALAIDESRGNFQAAPWVPPEAPNQIFEQVWFTGVHSNIGGGYEDHGLSDTSLLWMVGQIERYKLLDLNLQTIDDALDHTAPYLTGRLMNSRTLVWRMLGCKVPRPVGATSTAEKIHESAFDYKYAVYRGRRRQDWLAACGVPVFRRTPFEVQHAVSRVGRSMPRPRLSSVRLTGCDRIMQLFGGSA